MTSDDVRIRAWLVAAVIAHGAVAFWHGTAHQQIPVPLTSLQLAYVWVVIMVLPLLGASLFWTRWNNWAAPLITASMLGSLVFGLVNHFMLDSSDNVLSLPEHAQRESFVLTAALLIVTETMGAVLGAIAVLTPRRPRSARQGERSSAA